MQANRKDGEPWSDSDLLDLKVSIDSGLSLAETATVLSREGTVGDILQTANTHGWKFASLDGFPSMGFEKR